MEKKLKIAVIGCGGISECHLEAYSKNPDVEIYALCDVNEKNLNRRGDEYHVSRRYTDKDQMLAELPEIEKVDLHVDPSQVEPLEQKQEESTQPDASAPVQQEIPL